MSAASLNSPNWILRTFSRKEKIQPLHLYRPPPSVSCIYDVVVAGYSNANQCATMSAANQKAKALRAVMIGGALMFVFAWVVALILTASVVSKTGTSTSMFPTELQQPNGQTLLQQKENNNDLLSTFRDDDRLSKVIPGIELQIPSPMPNEDPIQVVYTTQKEDTKGLILLLHACSHSAYKFFSPSPSTCPNCVGLSEELRIVRLVIQQGYTPVAISSANRKRGCWLLARDLPRVKAVLEHELFHKYQKDQYHIIAIGASSGGAIAAELATRNVVEAALVMVMQLPSDVVSKLQASPKPIYLAPMPRDKHRTKQVLKNYHDLKNSGNKDFVVLDSTSCDSLPLTADYLVQRVPGMTDDSAKSLISILKEAGHINPSTNMLQVDPTKPKSDWRQILSPQNSTHWLNIFDLQPGVSPLAKALNRAWAFHEYCSEVVVPSFEFFERQFHDSSSST